MSKAVLVMDMPESCEECSLHNYHCCNVTGQSVESNLYDIKDENKPNWCPLKELPDEEYNDSQWDEYEVKRTENLRW